MSLNFTASIREIRNQVHPFLQLSEENALTEFFLACSSYVSLARCLFWLIPRLFHFFDLFALSLRTFQLKILVIATSAVTI